MNADKTRHIIQEGRQKWKNKYGDGPPRPIIQRRSRNVFPRFPSNKYIQAKNLAHFKTIPTIHADDYKRKWSGTTNACKCITYESHKAYINDHRTVDMLNVNCHLRTANFFTRYFCHLSYITYNRMYFTYTEITDRVLSSNRLEKVIQQKVADLSTCDSNLDLPTLALCLGKRSKKVLDNMKARMSNIIMVFSGWVLMKFFTRLLSRIQLHDGQLSLIQHVAKRGVPMVYLPSHRSHLDYILITVILWLHNVRVPHIAAGENLYLPIFSYFMKRQGAFFIRRRLDKCHGEKDVIYRAVLHSYMEEILKAGESLEFFIEGGRSRTGKPCRPKAGLLSVVVESCMQGIIDDAYIVPVNINYDRILEESFSHEQMGQPKRKESFTSVLKGLFNLFTSHYGTVRVDFCQPFSLKDYIAAMPPSGISSTSPYTDCDSPPMLTSTSPMRTFRSADSFFNGEFIVDKHRLYIDNIANHVIYNTVNATTLMSTNLVAFLLLTRHREWTSLMDLMDSFTSLVYDVTQNYKHDICFSGNVRDIVEYACTMLGDCVLKKFNKIKDIVLVSPNLAVPAIFDLLYYANSVISVYALDSIICCSVMSLSGLTIPALLSGCLSTSPSVTRQSVISAASQLSRLLHEEFILIPPCVSLDSELSDRVDQLVSLEVLVVPGDEQISGMSQEEENWVRRFERRQRWMVNEYDSEEETEPQLISVNLNRSDLLHKLVVHHRIIAPYIECLTLAVDHLIALESSEIPESTFLKQMHDKAVQRCECGQSSYVEHASMETHRNCIRSLSHLQYCNIYYVGSLRMIGQAYAPETSNRLAELRKFLQSMAL